MSFIPGYQQQTHFQLNIEITPWEISPPHHRHTRLSQSDSEITLRNGNYKDIPESVELGEAFHLEAELDFFAPADPPSFAKFLESILKGELNGIFVVAEQHNHIIGICIGLVVPVYFNYSHLASQELVFYVDQASRDTGVGKKLLEAFEKESIAKGAKTICVGAKSNMRVEAMGKMYSRKGYRELERYYVRSI